MRALEFCLNLFFPKRCAFCGKVLGFTDKCDECERVLPDISRNFEDAINKNGMELSFVDSAYAAFNYEPPLRNAILQMKFNGKEENAVALGKILGRKIAACKIMESFDIIVSVPSSKKSVKQRGYNIPLLLAKEVCRETGRPLVTDALCKDFDTAKQSTLSGVQRRGNLAGAFSVHSTEEIINKRILLIDDIITTGTTINECAKALRYASADNVIAAAVALASQKVHTDA